ncbi:hypothetical protein BH20ACI2_BH20ACI2_27440 [soil metagenome]
MKENCLDTGMVQAFMDGELSHDQIARVSDHLEGCHSCAYMLGQAEDEAAVVFSALDREFNTLVPTQRLWSKINDSIETQRKGTSFWQRAQAFLATAFASPSFVGAAGLLVAFGVFSLVLLNSDPLPADIAAVPGPVVVTAPAFEPLRVKATVTVNRVVDTLADARPRVERAVYRSISASKTSASRGERTVPALSNGYMEGEESYVKTIYSLARTAEEQKDSVLRPSERVAYERDMALVNDTIARMRHEVKRNPKNETAKQVLYSSYQNKIDLLNSVSQKEELVASLNR